MSSAPQVTVFTTFYQDNAHLDEMIRSVLAQTFREFEFLMIIDANPKAAQRIRETYPDPRIRIIEKDRSGIAAARNFGIREARAPLLAFIDSDDVCEPSRLELQVAYLHAHPECVLVGSAIRIIDEHSRETARRDYPTSDSAIRSTMLNFNVLATSAITARTSKLIEAGCFSETEFLYAEDYDLWLRMGELGELHNMPEALILYRVHSQGGKSSRTHLQLRDTIRVRLAARRRYKSYPTNFWYYPITLAQLTLRALPAPWVVKLFELTQLKRGAKSGPG